MEKETAGPPPCCGSEGNGKAYGTASFGHSHAADGGHWFREGIYRRADWSGYGGERDYRAFLGEQIA